MFIKRYFIIDSIHKKRHIQRKKNIKNHFRDKKRKKEIYNVYVHHLYFFFIVNVDLRVAHNQKKYNLLTHI